MKLSEACGKTHKQTIMNAIGQYPGSEIMKRASTATEDNLPDYTYAWSVVYSYSRFA